MLAVKLFRRTLFNSAKLLSDAAAAAVSSESQKPAAPRHTYGNTSMPDKLYKMIELETKSADQAVLKSYHMFIMMAAKELGIKTGLHWVIKPRKKRWTLLKSVHIYRKHLVQYEVRTYYRWLQLHEMTGSTADTFLEYIERMLPEGVGLKVTRVSIEPLPEYLEAEEVVKSLKESGYPVNETDVNKT